MNEDLLVTKEFLERLETLLKLMSIPHYNDEEKQTLTCFLFDDVSMMVDQYKEALEDLIVKEDIEEDYPVELIMNYDENGKLKTVGLSQDMWGMIPSVPNENIWWFKKRSFIQNWEAKE